MSEVKKTSSHNETFYFDNASVSKSWHVVETGEQRNVVYTIKTNRHQEESVAIDIDRFASLMKVIGMYPELRDIAKNVLFPSDSAKEATIGE